ncbi:MAG: TlpA family protein disulfide reductase [Bacteroidaceae bacterium]|nr:TlpA family protein disulfide reductase [Bacteroidaceae bacterium]
MKKVFFIVALFVMALQIVAQKIQLNVDLTFSEGEVSGTKLYAGPMGGSYESIKEMVADGNRFSVEIDASEFNFYNVTGVKDQAQTILPLFLAEKAGSANVKMEYDGKSFKFVGDDNNVALSELGNSISEMNIKVWKSGGQMSEESLRKMFTNYQDMIDSDRKVSAIVKEYMNIWAYTSVYNLVNSLPRILKKPVDEIPFTADEVLPAPDGVLDSPLASLFPMAVEIVRQRLPKGTFTEQINYMRTNYETEVLRAKVEEEILNRFVAKYDYSVDYEKGLKQLQDVTDKYGFDTKFVEQFKKNRATVKGNPFPAEVVLKDKAGNVVDFSSFRGKYVYIDVWASWCGPCIQQIPHLQKLESELQNDNVVFVSVSVDAKEEPWKKKMESLGVHGHQLWDSNGQLTKSLNISGIPFFLIYDSEGKLYMYDAPRPSQGEGLKQLLEGLGKN